MRWQENKVVGIAAGLILILSLGLLAWYILIKNRPSANNIPTQEEINKVMKRITR